MGGFTLPDSVTSSQWVLDPPDVNTEFTLQPGQSVTKTTTRRTTVLSGTGTTAPTLTATTTNAGDVSTVWYIVCKGVPAKTESRSSGGTQLIQLKSGNYNGAAL